MCTVVILREVVPGAPLVVAANRDELYDRPTDGPASGDGVVMSGRDGVAGGTWMGATRGGLVVALTNQHGHGPPDPARRSRGEVVAAALTAGDRVAARALLAALDPDAYNPFNLVFGDAAGVEVAYVRPGVAVEVADVPRGVTALANDRIGSPAFPRAARAVARARVVAGRGWPAAAAALGSALGDHAQPASDRVPTPPPGAPYPAALARALQAVCIHTPRYGTRSATVAAVTSVGLASYLVSAGPPCRAPLVEVWGGGG